MFSNVQSFEQLTLAHIRVIISFRASFVESQTSLYKDRSHSNRDKVASCVVDDSTTNISSSHSIDIPDPHLIDLKPFLSRLHHDIHLESYPGTTKEAHHLLRWHLAVVYLPRSGQRDPFERFSPLSSVGECGKRSRRA